MSGCRNCPKISTPPAQIITVKEPCMDPLPVLDVPKWPDKTGGVYVLDEGLVMRFSVLLGTLVTYIEEQQAKCLKTSED